MKTSRCFFCLFSIIFLGLSTQRLHALPTDFPTITVTNPAHTAPGNIFISNFTQDENVTNTPFLMILDNQGTPIKYKELTSLINTDFKIQPDGSFTYYQMFSTNTYSTNNQSFWFLDSSLNATSSIGAVVTNAEIWRTDLHELRMQTNGHGYLLAYRFTTKDMRPYGGYLAAVLIDMAIQEVDQNKNLYWHWNPSSFFDVENCTPDISKTERMVDFAHCNAIEIAPDGNSLLSTRYFDEITKINRTTGDILWRMGGSLCSNNQFQFINDAQPQQGGGTFTGFSHQHAPRYLDNGNILLFDNGNLKNPPNSRAVEYEINETTKTATKVWEYYHSPQIQSTEMGYAQRLPNGNTLICWGGNTNGVAVTEVTPAKEVVFELSLPPGVNTYRAYRLPYPSTAPQDFDGDGISDLACYYPPDGFWYMDRTRLGFETVTYGYAGTLPVSGDFDGDGFCDYGTYADAQGQWNIMRSSSGAWSTQFGYAGTQPVVGDFDGDRKLDFGCYYPDGGWWYIFKSATQELWVNQFGYEGTIPVVGDFDGDHIDDFGCYYPPAGWWYIFRSVSQELWTTQFGYEGTEPIVGDFDGDGLDDFGCYHAPDGWWYIFKSASQELWTTQFGYDGTDPIVGDYDGDGISDFGCYYPPAGWWYLYKSTTQQIWTTQFGYDGTIAVQ